MKWLDRSLITLDGYYILLTNQEDLDKTLRRLKLKNEFEGVSKSAGATTHFVEGEDGKFCALVCLFDKKHELEQTYALLVHEATHIWQRYVEGIGEINPSKEFEAYAIQKISQELFYSWKKQVRKK